MSLGVVRVVRINLTSTRLLAAWRALANAAFEMEGDS
jgi:hypothetical protein